MHNRRVCVSEFVGNEGVTSYLSTKVLHTLTIKNILICADVSILPRRKKKKERKKEESVKINTNVFYRKQTHNLQHPV